MALVSAFDVGKELPRDKIIETLSDATFTLAGVSPEILVDEKASHPDEFQLVKTAPELIDRPVLILTSDDKLADHVSPLIKAIRDRGGKLLVVNHVATDHSWSDHRIALETLILNWLAALP